MLLAWWKMFVLSSRTKMNQRNCWQSSTYLMAGMTFEWFRLCNVVNKIILLHDIIFFKSLKLRRGCNSFWRLWCGVPTNFNMLQRAWGVCNTVRRQSYNLWRWDDRYQYNSTAPTWTKLTLITGMPNQTNYPATRYYINPGHYSVQQITQR